MSENRSAVSALLRALSLTQLVLAVAGLITTFLVFGAIYRLYLHPLAKFPGPKLHALTNLVQIQLVVQGRWVHRVLALHEQYGPIVRVAPNEISYVNEDAWNDIYKAYKRNNEGQLPKAAPANPRARHGLFSQPSDRIHHELRKQLSPIMSDRGLREREYILQKYVFLLVSKLQEKESEALNIVGWYQAVTTDIVGCFMNKDVDFGCIAKGEPLSLMPQNEKALVELAVGTAFSKNLFTRKFIVERAAIPEYAPWQAVGRDRWDQARENSMEKSMDDGKEDLYSLLSNSRTITPELRRRAFFDFVLAGTDTVAITLSGITYQLLRNPDTLKRLQNEVRSAFTSAGEITLAGVNALKYSNAVITEGLRLWPPGPETQRRMVIAGGKTILGKYIPQGTHVGVYHWVAGRWSGAWKNHDKFVPERWLPENQGEKGAYKDDNRGVMQPYNVGPRNCVGQQLANAELRMILASLVWHFDIDFAEPWNEDEDWMDVKIFGLIAQKKPLMVKLSYIR